MQDFEFVSNKWIITQYLYYIEIGRSMKFEPTMIILLNMLKGSLWRPWVFGTHSQESCNFNIRTLVLSHVCWCFPEMQQLLLLHAKFVVPIPGN